MTAHLLLVTVGPVQDFIAQARRTRDLWFGSHVLSELSRTVACTLAEGGAELVFPALGRGAPELARRSTPGGLAVANKVLAQVPGDRDPRALAAAARTDCAERWREITRPVRDRWREKGLIPRDALPAWDEQVESLLEVLAAWQPLTNGYSAAREAVEAALGGRKVLRHFTPWTSQRGHVPKSSLDGGRETVLVRGQERPNTAETRALRIGPGEQLDAIGLVKRAGARPGQFAPIVNVACAAWLDEAGRRAPAHLTALREACRAAGVPGVEAPAAPWTKAFPFDADLLLPDRWRALATELELDEGWFRQHVGPLLARQVMGRAPSPYVACLVADGDRMGAALDALDGPDAHREVSRALARFAEAAGQEVARHRGSLVYAGGDDVLAFVGLSDALSLARALRAAFSRAMSEAGLPATCRTPTLSVGLGVGHVLDGMSHLLDLGRQAEKAAKLPTWPGGTDERDGLAVVFDKRSGGTTTWRAPWAEAPDQRLTDDMTAFAAGALSSSKVYEVRRALDRWAGRAADPGVAELVAHEVRRILGRSHLGETPVDLSGLGLILDVEPLREARRWVDRMLTARALADAQITSSPTGGGA